MIVKIKVPDVDLNGNIILRDYTDNIMVDCESLMSIDGSTKNTGVSIVRLSDGALRYSCSFMREADETPVRYKVRIKKYIEEILIQNQLIESVYYEEPFIGYAGAAKNLLMLRSFVEEIIIENEPKLDYIKHYEVNNMKWKKLFLAPDKCPAGTELQKSAVRKKLEQYMPFMSAVSQDEIDSYCLGFVAATKIREGTDETLESKKVHPFQYNVSFYGADEDEAIFVDFMDLYDGPKSILSNGIKLCQIGNTGNFDKFVYKEMGNDDKVLIVKFSSDHHANLILKHKLGTLSVNYDYIYAFIWRKTRK
ncbi:MAG: hypothetical protein IJ593_11075 [Lachnospiraceae bacterium]|nr:hypothetical protein [Lachnospiraceae bacterium]